MNGSGQSRDQNDQGGEPAAGQDEPEAGIAPAAATNDGATNDAGTRLDGGEDPGRDGAPAKPRPERRTRPSSRPAMQMGFDRLRVLLEKAGRSDILKRLESLGTVDDVLREQPTLVPTLLALAWEMRSQPGFAPLFRGTDQRTIVSHPDTPIFPCGLSFTEVQRVHLLGATRLACERLERAWCQRRAQQERDRVRRERQQQARSSLQTRLMGSLKTMLDGDGEVSPSQFRTEYPGHGVYQSLKAELQDPWQFQMLDLYARMSSAQARMVNHLIRHLTTREALERVVRMDAEDLALVRTVCRAHAKMILTLQLSPDPLWQMTPEEQADARIAAERVDMLENATFDALILKQPAAVEAIVTLGLRNASEVIRRLTPVFGDDMWTIMEDEQALNNARSMPNHLLTVLGPVSRHVPPGISEILNCIRDRALARDLLGLARETFPDDTLGAYLADPDRKPIWNSLPAKFNNAYRYQRDAESGSGLRNLEDLTTVARALFHSLEIGSLE